jgi:hypothetical protein
MAFNGIILYNILWKLVTWFKRQQNTHTQPNIEISSYSNCFRKESRMQTSILTCHTSEQFIADLSRSLLYVYVPYNTFRTSVCLLVYACIDKATTISSPRSNPLAPPTHLDCMPHCSKEIICGPDISTYWKRIYFSISQLHPIFFIP